MVSYTLVWVQKQIISKSEIPKCEVENPEGQETLYAEYKTKQYFKSVTNVSSVVKIRKSASAL